MKDWNFTSLARQIWGEEEDYGEMLLGKERINYVFSLFPDLLRNKGTYSELRREIERLLSPFRDCIIDLIPEDIPFHGFIGEREIGEGELITLDCTLRLDHFWVDMAGTWPVGSIDEERQKLLRDAENIFYGALGLSRPGLPFRDVTDEIGRYLAGSPCRLVPECGGHGIGREIHQGEEYIYSQGKASLILPETGAFTVEPVIALDTNETTLYAYFEETIVCGF